MRLTSIYNDAVNAMHAANTKMASEKRAAYEEALKIFQTISGWKDTDEQIYICQRKIDEIKAKEEAALKIHNKALAIVCAFIAFVIVLMVILHNVEMG